MKNLGLLFLPVLLPFMVPAQVSISGKVTDQTGRPIPFANIGFVGTSIGTVSTVTGEFELILDETRQDGSLLRFSCMGYEAEELAISQAVSTDQLHIKLKETTLVLQEMIVKSGGLQTKEYGNKDEKTSMKTNLAISERPNMNLGAQIGRKFRLGSRANFVSKLKFYVGYNNFDSLLIRVNFYDLESGKPSKNLNQRPIIRPVIAHKRGWVTFDLENENLVLSGTIVAAIEWIGASSRGNQFGLNISMPALFQTHYYKYGAQNDWKVFPNMSTSMVLIVESAD